MLTARQYKVKYATRSLKSDDCQAPKIWASLGRWGEVRGLGGFDLDRVDRRAIEEEVDAEIEVGLGGDLLGDAEVALDRGDPFEGVIDFLAEARDVLEFFLEVVEFLPDLFEYVFDARQLSTESGDVAFEFCLDVGDVLGERRKLPIGRHEDALLG